MFEILQQIKEICENQQGAFLKASIDNIPKNIIVFKDIVDIINQYEEKEIKSLSIIRYKNMILNIDNHTVTLDGEEVKLEKKKLLLLYMFLSNPGKVFSRQQILEKIWNEDADVYDRTVDVHISYLRKRVPILKGKIVAFCGIGYKFIG